MSSLSTPADLAVRTRKPAARCPLSVRVLGRCCASCRSFSVSLSTLAAAWSSLAASAGTREDHHRIRTALDALDQVKTSETAAEAVRDFHHSIAVASHNGLLVALCGFLVEVQTELGYELMGSSAELWQKLFAKLKPIRADLVDAVIQRTPEAAVTSAREFHAKAVHLLTSLPKAKEVRLADPKLRDLLLSMMSRVGSG